MSTQISPRLAIPSLLPTTAARRRGRRLAARPVRLDGRMDALAAALRPQFWTGLFDTISGGSLGRRALALGFLLGALFGGATPAMAADPAAGGTAAALTVAMLPTVSLRSEVSVNSSDIRLGDIFLGCGAHADDVVAQAPPPGGTMTLDLAWLTTTASEHGLSWQPTNDSVSLSVRRAATIIDSDAIGQQLLEHIAGGRPDRQVRLDNAVRLYVPVGASTDIAVDDLDYDAVSGHFNADLRVPANDPTAPIQHVSGRVIDILDLPALARPMMPGEVITRADIAWIKVPAEQVPPGDLEGLDGLVGFQPCHPLRAGQPLRATDVEQPLLVHRNDAVLIVLQAPGLYITAEGKAMADGSIGAVVPVMNMQSRRVIQTVVTGMGEVGLSMQADDQLAAVNE